MLFKCTKILQGFASSPFLKPPPPIKKIQPPLPPPKINKNINIQDKSNSNKKYLNQSPLINNLKKTETIVSSEPVQMYQPRKKSAVVTIMGHVDHGKTTLIDFLRKSNIADKQHGGITQKIGAFHIQCHGQKITFIDTPGHEAFFSMRQRGAGMTDVIVLIVSAVEGVKKQTLQIIKLINQKNIRTIVAISKLDLQNADPQQVQKSLHEAGLNLQPMGGNIPVVHISAKTGQNVQLLSELILQETKQLTAIFEGNVQGAVLQANKNHQGLNSMTMIIQRGTLKPGAILIVGDQFTKVKYMHDDKGNSLSQGIPGDAVQIVGIPIVPNAGQFIYQVSDEKKAKFIVDKKKQECNKSTTSIGNEDSKIQSTKIKIKNRRQRKAFCRGFSQRWLNHYKETELKIQQELQALRSKPETPEILSQISLKEQQLKNHHLYVQEYLMNTKDKKNTLNLILKFSDRGIQETILQQMEETVQKIKKKYKIEINVLKTDIGNISLGDLKDAKMANAQIVSFGVEIDSQAVQIINQCKIVPKCHNLIHSFLKQLEETAFQKKRNSINGVQKGNAQVCEVYTLKKGKKDSFNAVGIRVKNGKMEKKNAFVLFREGIPISEPMYASSIKIFKKQSLQVKKGDECCVTFDQKQAVTFEKGDQIYSYEM